MIDRRSLVAGAVGLAIVATVPEMSDDGLTAEERELMALLPSHLTADERAFMLAGLRDPDPLMRAFKRRLIRTMATMTAAQRRQFVSALEATLPDDAGSV